MIKAKDREPKRAKMVAGILQPMELKQLYFPGILNRNCLFTRRFQIILFFIELLGWFDSWIWIFLRKGINLLLHSEKVKRNLPLMRNLPLRDDSDGLSFPESVPVSRGSPPVNDFSESNNSFPVEAKPASASLSGRENRTLLPCYRVINGLRSRARLTRRGLQKLDR